MNHVDKLCIGELQDMAMRLAPAFRSKYDFSDPKDYDHVAHHAFQQAIALRKRANELHDEAAIKDAEEAQKAAKEAAK